MTTPGSQAAYQPVSAETHRVRIGWFNTAAAAGRAADKLAPTHPSSTLVISQTGPHGQWVLAAEARRDT